MVSPVPWGDTPKLCSDSVRTRGVVPVHPHRSAAGCVFRYMQSVVHSFKTEIAHAIEPH